jgi:brefeldin A-inhibited guanine nucleotide-exchange protein
MEDDEPKLATDLPTPTSSATAGNTGLESYRPSTTSQSTPVPVTAARRRFFNQIITQCVLTLLMIETVNELFSNDSVYTQIPSPELLRLMGLLKKSYHFARKFNNDRDLRTRLFREGFMKQPPNLLKQESGAAATYVAILLRMYHDPNPARVGSRDATESALVPLCADILKSYLDLDEETQARNIGTWRPVVVDVLEGYAGFGPSEFEKHVRTFAPLVVVLLGREMGPEIQTSVQRIFARVVEVGLGVDVSTFVSDGKPGSRRGSRGSRGSRGR